MKKQILLLISCSFCLHSFCQNILVFKNSDGLKVKTSESLPDLVKYNKWDNQNGTMYAEPKENIFIIKYWNGSKDVFGNRATSSNEASDSDLNVTQLLTGLEYPQGLCINGNVVYLTETAGRNTSFGGKICLEQFSLSDNLKTVLKNNPENSDAIVLANDGKIYLSSYYKSTPGNYGKVSVFDFNTSLETHLLDIKIAVQDMFLNSSNDIVLIGSSDLPGAKSLYSFPSTDYANPTILKTGLGRVWCAAQNGSDIYFSDRSSIKYFGSDGVIKTFYKRSVMSMSFSAQYLYYADYFGGKIGRINISSGVDETIISNLNHPKTVRYDFATNNLYFLEAGTEAKKFKNGTLSVVSPESSNSNTNSGNILNGNWSGNIYQKGVKKPYAIELSCNVADNEYKVNYPAYGCSGFWEVEQSSDTSIDFREHILTGKCVDGGLVKLSLINDNQLECIFYRANSNAVNAKGTLTKE